MASPRFMSTTTTATPFSSRSGAARCRSAYAVDVTGSDEMAHLSRYSLQHKLTLQCQAYTAVPTSAIPNGNRIQSTTLT